MKKLRGKYLDRDTLSSASGAKILTPVSPEPPFPGAFWHAMHLSSTLTDDRSSKLGSFLSLRPAFVGTPGREWMVPADSQHFVINDKVTLPVNEHIGILFAHLPPVHLVGVSQASRC